MDLVFVDKYTKDSQVGPQYASCSLKATWSQSVCHSFLSITLICTLREVPGDSSYLFPQESCEILWDPRWQYQISIQELDLGSKSWISKSWRVGCTMESHLGSHEIWAALFYFSQWDAKWWHPTELWRRGSYGGVMTQISLGTTVYVLPLSPVSFSFVFPCTPV